MAYRPRTIDADVMASLRSAGALLIEGPRACGKTESARQAARSEVLLDIDEQARSLAAIDPGLLLEGDTPRLIDEWQIVPGIWDHVRRTVDARRAADPASGVGQFILTGSAVPADDLTRHVGSGRFVRLRMRPMTLAEAGHSTGSVSFASVIDGAVVRATDPGLDFDRLLELLCIGGWPGNLGASADDAQRLLRGYLSDVARVDVQRVDSARRDPRLVDRLLRSLARNVATATPVANLRRDVNGDRGTHKDETIAAYLDALARVMIIEDLPAWAPSIRSRTRLRVAAVRHFVDPSLAVAAVRANPARLKRDLEWTGLLFENLVVRDIRVFAEALGGQVFSYRDESGLEADAVIETKDGRWAAFEVKLGQAQIEDAAQNLIRLKGRIDATVAGEPVALVVVTGSGYAYTRSDGVSVIPIGALTA
jgi:predicted AAA+ superfamily ATPase